MRPQDAAAPSKECADELDSALRLAAYKWFIPCFVNELPLRTLLVCWDRMLMRSPPAEQHYAYGRTSGLSAAHLQLALALVRRCEPELLALLRAGRSLDVQALGFQKLLGAATSADEPAPLLADAAGFELSAEQLTFLRVGLKDEGGGSGSGGGGGGVGPGAGAELLSGMQEEVLSLLARRRGEALPLRVLKATLLLRAPQPPPLSSLACYMPLHYPRLVSACALTCAGAVLAFYRRVPVPSWGGGGSTAGASSTRS